MKKDDLHHKLEAHFRPSYLEVKDVSHRHANHNEEAKQGGTHFEVAMTSALFNGQPLLKRHRMVNELLKDAFENTPLHALKLNLKSEQGV